MEAAELRPVAEGVGAGVAQQPEPSRELAGELDTREQEQYVLQLGEAKPQPRVDLATCGIHRLVVTGHAGITETESASQANGVVLVL